MDPRLSTAKAGVEIRKVALKVRLPKITAGFGLEILGLVALRFPRTALLIVLVATFIYTYTTANITSMMLRFYQQIERYRSRVSAVAAPLPMRCGGCKSLASTSPTAAPPSPLSAAA